MYNTEFWMRSAIYLMELVACVTGFIFWRKISGSYWKWFPVYLAVVFISEVTVEVLANIPGCRTVANDIVLFWSIPLEFLFIFWLFYSEYKNRGDRRWPVLAAAVYLITWLIDIIWFKNVQFSFTSLSYEVGNVLLLALIILFLIRFMLSNDILHYKINTMFWVSIGLLVFYLGSLPYFALYNNLYKYNRILFHNYWKVMMVLNYIMYGFFTLSFIWSKKKS
jgi:hypothetical protein